MADATLVLEHSVEAEVSVAFAWRWRTDVANWVDPPATFTLAGPFEPGSAGTTLMPGQTPIRWRIGAVIPERSFVIEMPLDDAVLAFEWLFDALGESRMRLTQRVLLAGAGAAAYLVQVKAGFGATLTAGMKRIAADMVSAARRQAANGP